MYSSKNSRLIIPSLRANMGDWTYYTTSLKMRDVAQRVRYAKEIHSSKKLSELIQRQLDSKRTEQIASYLLMQEQRFFNALVVGIYKGAPEWYELDIRDNHIFNADELPSYIEGAFGLIVLNGEEQLFALDGQHRVAGIRKAVQRSNKFGNEEISVILIAHEESEIGRERTRRLFTSLNRYAKPVSTYEKIALDEDDIVAIIVRMLVEKHRLFSDQRISTGRGSSIPTSDRDSFTTLYFLYKALDRYLKQKKYELENIHKQLDISFVHFEGRWTWNKFKQLRPEETLIHHFFSKATDFWDIMIDNFACLKDYLDNDRESDLALPYRNTEGGCIIFRPIGLEIIVQVIVWLIEEETEVNDAVGRVAAVPMMLEEVPWKNLLWNQASKTMITAKDNRKIASVLLLHWVKGDISKTRHDLKSLRVKLAGVLSRDKDDPELAKYFPSD